MQATNGPQAPLDPVVEHNPFARNVQWDPNSRGPMAPLDPQPKGQRTEPFPAQDQQEAE